MKLALGRIREIVEKHDLIALVTSIFSLVLGLISFIQAGLSFDWMHVSVGCFYVLFGLGSILIRFTRLPERCHPYLLGAITILLCLGPMGVGLYLLVSRARGFALFYDWIAYV